MSISLRKPKWLGRGALALVAGAVLLASVPTPARAVMLPGSALFGYYDVDGFTGTGDSILRLINPSGNANIGFGPVVNSCAMIYVFDDQQEMGECCGCPLSPSQLATFSVEKNLLSDWALPETPEQGSIAIRSTSINATGCQSFAFPGNTNPACNGGCDPTIGPTGGTPTLLGSITHVQDIDNPSTITEVSLFDNGTGNDINNTYLIEQCGALLGNASGGGICNCPVE